MTVDEMRELLSQVAYRGFAFCLRLDGDRPYLQLEWDDTCTATGRPERQKSRKWMLSPHMTRSEVVQTAFKAVLTAEEHEVRERFTWRGEPIFRPHFDIQALWLLSARRAVERRDDPTARETAS